LVSFLPICVKANDVTTKSSRMDNFCKRLMK